MKKFLAVSALMMISSATLMAEDFVVEAVVESEVSLERANKEAIKVKMGEEKTSDTITVKSNCLAKLSAQTDGKLKIKDGQDTIPFEAFVVKDSTQPVAIAATEGEVLRDLVDNNTFEIKVKIPAVTTTPAAGTYEGKITLTVSGQ